ncbi:MAG TPA: hypothetical protein VFQ53_42045 [Kofleriaceae bacterium]|nr:hypothetical protein [Kofleriaceae bacterium]
MRRLPILLLSLGLSLVACRGGGDDGGGDDTTPDAPPVGGSVTIQEVQADSMPVGTAVELDGVVVTAIDAFGARTGDLWVEEPGGGEFSGIKVFGAPLDQIASLAPGDIVTISNAEKDEFALSMDMTGRKVTEIKGAAGGTLSIVKTGTGSLPPIATVDALAIENLADQAAKDAEWEKWEGVLITVTNARQNSAVAGFTMNPAEDQFEFRATGDLRVQSALTTLGADAVAGVCYQGLTGVSDYFFNHLLLPRSTADLVGGGTGCSAQTVATIADIQSGAVTGDVKIENVFVTGVGFGQRNLWISTSLTAAPNEGVFVFGGPTLDASVVPGVKVTLTGTVSEFNDDANGGTLTEITSPGFIFDPAAPGTVVPVTGKTVADLLDPTTAAAHESVLVTLTNVNISALGNAANGFIADATQAGTAFKMQTTILRLASTDLGCYQSITGFWTNLQAPGSGATTKPNAFGFIPRTLGAKGTNCN